MRHRRRSGHEGHRKASRISQDHGWFLDRIATHILAFEGNYSEYEADRKRRLGKDADQPHRIRYRKLTR